MLIIKDVGELVYDSVLPNKKTLRCPEKILAHDSKGEKFLVVHAQTYTQKFYLKRSIQMQENFEQINCKAFSLNKPLYYGEHLDGDYAIYKYYDGLLETRGDYPDKVIRQYYKSCQEVECTPKVINTIIEDFLSGWPKEYRGEIENLKEFKAYQLELQNYKKIVCGFQHGDYTPNNILHKKDEDVFVMDFEFSMTFQPIGFDLYDYHYALDKKYNDIPYLDINSKKEELQNSINKLMDIKCNIVVQECENLDNSFPFRWADCMVYNRPDLYDKENSYLIKAEYDEEVYWAFYTIEKYKSHLNVWLKKIPSVVMGVFVKYIFKKHHNVIKIEVLNSSSDCDNKLTIDNNWVVFLPREKGQILQNLTGKSRHSFKRKQRMLEEEYGALRIESYQKDFIPLDAMQTYFKWKKETHGIDYKLTPAEYVTQYHVTGAMTLKAGEELAAILFYCKNESDVYFENISYNTKLSKFSPGIILYENFLEKMVDDNVNAVFLGNGNQSYKERFGSTEFIVFSGELYKNNFIKMVNLIKKGLAKMVR